MKTKITNYFTYISAPLGIMFMEAVLGFSIAKNISTEQILCIFLFSICYGFALSSLTAFFRSEKSRHAFSGIVLLILGIVFCIFYFVNIAFGMYYDLNTIFSAAGGAVTGFGKDIFKMIFSPSGLLHIILFLLPSLTEVVLLTKSDNNKTTNFSQIVLQAVSCVAIAILFYFAGNSRVNIAENTMLLYSSQYNFNGAINSFGLLSGIRLDAEHNFFDSDSGQMYIEENTVNATDSKSPEESIGKHILEIDFDTLLAGDDETYRSIDEYVMSLQPESENRFTGKFKGKNLIFITAEAFSKEVIDSERTPTLYRLATKGIEFTDYYQPSIAGTTGGEFNNLMGMFPMEGAKSMQSVTENNRIITMANQLEGYYGKAFHNNDYTFYRRDMTHNMLGYSDGFMGIGNGLENYVSTAWWPRSDDEMIKNTFELYKDKQPFNIYYMTVSGHSIYSNDTNRNSYNNKEEVRDMTCSETLKAYFACQLELEHAMKSLVDMLYAEGIADNTVICLTADHFPYGLDQNGDTKNQPYLTELYGQKITDDLTRDHNRLIIWSGCLENEEPVKVKSPVTSLDILPTLLNLFGVKYDSRLLPGRDVFSDSEALAFGCGYEWKTELGTYANGVFTPVSDDVVIPEDYVEKHKIIVQNKISYCKKVQNCNYFAHVLGEE